MKRVIVICEGPTEVAFCNDVLVPYFSRRDIHLQTPLIKKSGGGIVHWDILKKQIELHLMDKNAIVTSLIDYYGIYPKHAFPAWDKSQDIPNKFKRMDFLEEAMKNELPDAVQYRFIPYFQLHEFEGLLFNDFSVFERNFTRQELLDAQELRNVIDTHENPETINDHKETAPSKRLCKLIAGYNKIVHGAILAEEIGLDGIRTKCVRFNHWMNQLEE